MTAVLTVETNEQIPLTLTVDREGSGGVTGLSPTVAVRHAFTGEYLDWTDNLFKSAGWTLKNGSMTMFGAGHYQRLLDVALLIVDPEDVLIAEYVVVDGLNTQTAADTIQVKRVDQDASLVRKAVTNRQEEFAGEPGRIILFDDDGLTKILEQELRDGANNGIDLAIRVPAKRTANIL